MEEQTGEEEDISAVLHRDALFGALVGEEDGPGGVFSQAAGISRAPKHGVICLEIGEMGSSFCGGVVGAQGIKMCIKVDCTLKTHQNKARDLFPEPHMVFIQGQGAKGMLPTTVFSAPAVPRSIFENESWTTHWAASQKTLKAWQVSFDSLVAAGKKLDAEASMAMCDRTEKAVTFAVTPRKRDRNSAGSSESTWVTVAVESPINPMLDDLGPSEIMLTNLGSAWRTLAENVTTIDKIARAAHARVKGCETATNDDLEQVDFKLVALHSLLGERPAWFGTQSAFEALAAALDNVEAIGKGLGKIETDLDVVLSESFRYLRESVVSVLSSQLSVAVTKQIKSQVFSGPFYNDFVVPATDLVRRCSPGPGQAGELWEGRFADLETKLEALRSLVREPSAGCTELDQANGGVDVRMAWGGEAGSGPLCWAAPWRNAHRSERWVRSVRQSSRCAGDVHASGALGNGAQDAEAPAGIPRSTCADGHWRYWHDGTDGL